MQQSTGLALSAHTRVVSLIGVPTLSEATESHSVDQSIHTRFRVSCVTDPSGDGPGCGTSRTRVAGECLIGDASCIAVRELSVFKSTTVKVAAFTIKKGWDLIHREFQIPSRVRF